MFRHNRQEVRMMRISIGIAKCRVAIRVIPSQDYRTSLSTGSVHLLSPFDDCDGVNKAEIVDTVTSERLRASNTA
ncbi:hypothetical protein GHT06_016609 [Daphnia sinensis]|uniref:Uncharacterized protein n=1 Tax=Daphnia sinensis TaxID=1820382 RepID=A0AAD5LFL8_9CRUS|nr:hypothetical protein GHT06_016609 [Daphnia sinensis]